MFVGCFGVLRFTMKILVARFPDSIDGSGQDAEDSLNGIQVLVFVRFPIVKLQKGELQ